MSIFGRFLRRFTQSSSSSEARDALPPKRISAFLVLMASGRRNDGDELLERLLDQKQADLAAKPRRFFVDNDTWSDSWWSESDVLVRSIARVLGDTAEQAEVNAVAALLRTVHEQSGLAVSADAMRLHTFTYDGLEGATTMMLEDRELRATSILKCRKCGKSFDFDTTADMVSVEQTYGVLLACGPVVVHESNLERPAPDLVAESSGPERTGIAKAALAALRSGRYRRWYHQGCDAVMGYPGAFFRADL